MHRFNNMHVMTDNRQAALELGQKPVGQLLWQYALPAIVAMTRPCYDRTDCGS